MEMGRGDDVEYLNFCLMDFVVLVLIIFSKLILLLFEYAIDSGYGHFDKRIHSTFHS